MESVNNYGNYHKWIWSSTIDALIRNTFMKREKCLGNKWVTTILNVTQSHKNLFNEKIPEPTFHAPLHHITKRYSTHFSSLPRRGARVRFPSRALMGIPISASSYVKILFRSIQSMLLLYSYYQAQ